MELEPTAFLYSGNQVYIAEMFERYLDDPHSVDQRWQDFFADMEAEAKDISADRRGASWAPSDAGVIGRGDLTTLSEQMTRGHETAQPINLTAQASVQHTSAVKTREATLDSIRALMMIRAYRVRGHLKAKLDPLGLEEPTEHPELDPQTYGFSEKDMDFAQNHIRILSGLYGVLKPLDLMQAYRLEMGTPLKKGRKKNLYEFWGRRITDLINADLNENGGDTIINLASKEYFHAVKPALLQGRLINIHFRENRNGQYKVISFTAKKARGRMANLIVKERVTLAENLKEFVVNDYIYNKQLSTETDWVYTID